MRYPASEKLEIIRLVEQSYLPIKQTFLNVDLSNPWARFNSYNPSQDNPTEPELTNQFIPGYEGYQRRVGEMIMRQHRQVFG